VAALAEVDDVGMAMMVNNARAAMKFFMTYLFFSADHVHVSHPKFTKRALATPNPRKYSKCW
jgi:hypothetical protein